MPVRVNIHHLKDRDIRLRGELPPGELDLDQADELIHARQPLRYDLSVQKTGCDLLVQGSLKVELDCECSRCLKPLKIPLQLEPWAVLVPLEGEEKVDIKDDSVDLTPYIREDILLEFPQHPLCETGCAGLPNRAEPRAEKSGGSGPAANSSAWAPLNKLKLK